ncbi:nucleoside/nucleotide kinase family protein [Planosporangium thailandense]|uniref:Nucleoside/nucleotide kinase family protein n=1 Tax=Planosporangium thailandense TaxID=765197 RepID=A0ABX0XZL6_9ACTN|nr:nucleoside/nucleotide kinase family protein [Planosporangium thailandense]
MDESTVDALVTRARLLAGDGRRRILGITGAPGAGKSTLAARIVAELGPLATLVPMDGYHLSEAELHRLGRHDRKGAIDTFDAAGFVCLLRRLRAPGPATVYAPEFRRDLEESIAGAIPVPPDVPLVVTEGNYLLVDQGEWAAVRDLVDEAWYVEVDEETRLSRLVARHVAFGRPPREAEHRAYGSDQRNAELIAGTRARADLRIRFAAG